MPSKGQGTVNSMALFNLVPGPPRGKDNYPSRGLSPGYRINATCGLVVNGRTWYDIIVREITCVSTAYPSCTEAH